MYVSDLLKRQQGEPVHTVGASQTVASAIHQFVTEDVRSLVVKDEDVILGVITVKDVLGRIDRRGGEALTEQVADDMTTGVALVTPQTTAEEVEKLFEHKHINHLPVLEGDELVGVLTPADVVAGQLHDEHRVSEPLVDYIHHGGHPTLDV